MRVIKRVLTFGLVAALTLSTATIAFADVRAFSEDSDEVLESFAQEYGWDKDMVSEAEWTGIMNEGEYRRPVSYQKEAFQDLLKEAKEYCVENNIIKASSAGGFGGRKIAQIARAEVDEPDSMEIPMGSNRTKYNDWFYGRAGAEAPWCAIFVSWCADQAGLIESGLFRKDAGVTTTYSYLTNEKGFESYGWREVKQMGGGSYSASPGDIFFFEGMGHIGIVTNVTENSIEVTHGNSSDNNVKATEMSPSGYMNYGTIVHVEYGLGTGELDGDSVEEACFYFFTEYMGMTIAGAAGALANIEAESSFNVGARGDPDKGGSYGICQWNGGAGRYYRLVDYCDANGLDWETLEGQLYYLEYELKTFYQSTYNVMMSAEDSPSGASYAAYTWCVQFEIPADAESKGYARGSRASDYYFPKYWNAASA